MADIPAGTLMHRYFGMDISHPDAPHLGVWRLRLAERIDYRANVMRPSDELFGRLAF
jgi:glutathione S-transferase